MNRDPPGGVSARRKYEYYTKTRREHWGELDTHCNSLSSLSCQLVLHLLGRGAHECQIGLGELRRLACVPRCRMILQPLHERRQPAQLSWKRRREAARLDGTAARRAGPTRLLHSARPVRLAAKGELQRQRAVCIPRTIVVLARKGDIAASAATAAQLLAPAEVSDMVAASVPHAFGAPLAVAVDAVGRRLAVANELLRPPAGRRCSMRRRKPAARPAFTCRLQRMLVRGRRWTEGTREQWAERRGHRGADIFGRRAVGRQDSGWAFFLRGQAPVVKGAGGRRALDGR